MFFIRAESSLVTTANFWKAAPMSSSSSSLVRAVSPSLSRALEKSISRLTWSEIVIQWLVATTSHDLLIPDCWMSLTDFLSFSRESLSCARACKEWNSYNDVIKTRLTGTLTVLLTRWLVLSVLIAQLSKHSAYYYESSLSLMLYGVCSS